MASGFIIHTQLKALQVSDSKNEWFENKGFDFQVSEDTDRNEEDMWESKKYHFPISYVNKKHCVKLEIRHV
jgi:hypothetical protein